MAIESGRIIPESDGQIDFEKADASWKAKTHPTLGKRASAIVGRPSAVNDGAKIEAAMSASVNAAASVGVPDTPREEEPDFFKARALSEVVKGRLLELDYAKKVGEVVEFAPFDSFVTGMILKARDELCRIGPELRDRLAQETDAIKCERMIDERIERVLNALAKYRSSAQAQRAS